MLAFQSLKSKMNIDLDNLFQQVINSNDTSQDKTLPLQPSTSCDFDDIKSKQFDEIFSFQGKNSSNIGEINSINEKAESNGTKMPWDWSLDSNLYDAKIENIKNQLTSDIQGKYTYSYKMSKSKGTPGIEPGTSRSAVECSTPELYPLRSSS